MDLTDLEQKVNDLIGDARRIEKLALDALEGIKRVDRLIETSPPEVTREVFRELESEFKKLAAKKAKGEITIESQLSEILRITQNMGYRIGSENRPPGPAELKNIRSAAKASVDRRLEKDAKKALQEEARGDSKYRA